MRYESGRASYFEVLEAQQQLFPAEDALAQTQRDQLVAVVNLWKRLVVGGVPRSNSVACKTSPPAVLTNPEGNDDVIQRRIEPKTASGQRGGRSS